MNFTLNINPTVELKPTEFIIKITQIVTTTIKLVVTILDSIYQGD